MAGQSLVLQECEMLQGTILQGLAALLGFQLCPWAEAAREGGSEGRGKEGAEAGAEWPGGASRGW